MSRAAERACARRCRGCATTSGARRQERGFIIIAVVVSLVIVAAVAMLLATEGGMAVDRTARGTEALQADYLAKAALEHALWQNNANVCSGDFSIPATLLGTHSYTASATGGGTTTAYSLSADQDAWIRDDQPDVNNNTATQHIRFESGVTEQALYRFDLSSLPAGAQINSASARFYLKSPQTHPEGPITVHRITTDWTEAGVTWNAFNGGFEASVLDTVPAQDQTGVWVQVNLTAQTQAWVNGQPNYGVLLDSTAAGIHTQYVSREGAANEQPRLEVVVGTAPASPVNIQATGTLANGVTRTLSRPVALAVQSPNTLALQPDGAAGTDAYIWEWFKTTNYGNDDETWVSLANNSTSRSLFRFDLAGVPARSKILSATLSLHHESGNNANVPITAHRISNPWNEAFVTWNRRDNGINWNTAGGDFDAAVVSTTDVGPASDIRYEWDITSLVQGWTDGAYPNYGVALSTARSNSTGERFYTSDETTVTRRPRLTVQYACECGSACLAPQGSGNVLMVVVNPTTLVPADATKKALFESWGYTVNVIGESENAAAYAAGAASNDVVYISESVNSAQVGTKLVDLSIGVVSQDGAYNDDLGFAGGGSWPVSPAITVTDASHYITSVFPAGPLDIYSGGMEQLTVSGGAAAGLQTLATTSGAGSLVALETGAALFGGGTAAGRRVMLPLGRESTLNWSYLNNNGRLIVQRALAWGSDTGSDTGCGTTQPLLMIVADSASPTAEELARETLLKTWCYSVSMMTASEPQATYDTIADSYDVVYVPSSVSYADVTSKLKLQPVGVVNEVSTLSSYLGFTSGTSGYTGTVTELTDNSHYITSGLTLGSLPITTTSTSLRTFVNTMGPGFKTLATRPSYTYPMIMTLETGDELLWGGNAAGRRVMLPWGGSSTFDINNLTADGQTILQRSLEWADTANNGSTYAVLMIVADPASPAQAAADRKALMESWGYTVTLIDDDDSTVNLAAAIDVADVIYIGAGTTNTAGVTKMLADISKGVVNEPSLLVSAAGFASSVNVAFAVDKLTIIDSAHSISQGFASPVTVFTALAVPTVLSGTLSPDLQNLGEFLGAPALAVLESGAARHDTGTAPGRRAQLPFEAALGSDLTADGQLIVRRAIEWAAIDGGGGGSGLLEYLDEFNTRNCVSADYAGTDGALDWSPWLWTETGEADGACRGLVQIVDDPAVADPGSYRLMLDERNRRVDRRLDLSEFTSATLSFDYRLYNYPTSSDSFVVIASANGTNWQKVGVFTGIVSQTGYQTATYDITSFIGPNAGIGFMTEGINTIQTAYIDNVRVVDSASGGGGGGGGSLSSQVVFESLADANLPSDGGALTVPAPAGTVAGDLLIATIVTDGEQKPVMSAPAGWTLIDHGSTSKQVTMDVFWKIAGMSEPGSYGFGWQRGQEAYAWIMRFTGHDSSDPIADVASAGGGSSSPASPAVTTSVPNALVLRIGGFDDNSITVGDPGLAGHTAITMNASSAGTTGASGGAGYVTQPTAGNSGTSTFSLTASERYRAVTVAIAPAP